MWRKKELSIKWLNPPLQLYSKLHLKHKKLSQKKQKTTKKVATKKAITNKKVVAVKQAPVADVSTNPVDSKITQGSPSPVVQGKVASPKVANKKKSPKSDAFKRVVSSATEKSKKKIKGGKWVGKKVKEAKNSYEE